MPRVPDDEACAAYYRIKSGRGRDEDWHKACCWIYRASFLTAFLDRNASPDDARAFAQESTGRFFVALKEGRFPV